MVKKTVSQNQTVRLCGARKSTLNLKKRVGLVRINIFSYRALKINFNFNSAMTNKEAMEQPRTNETHYMRS